MNHGVLFRWRLSKAFALLFIFALILVLSAHWSELVAQIVQYQKALHLRLSEHIQAVTRKPLETAFALIALSFVYGVFHAIGPGHGKAVISTYLAANRETLRRGIFISFASALLQSMTAIVLVTALAKLFSFKLAEIHLYGSGIAGVSYLLVLALGLILMANALKRLFVLKQTVRTRNIEHAVLGNSAHHRHDHRESCGCSHGYAPESLPSAFQTLSLIVSMGIRPCSGAIVVLIYAHLVGVFGYGMLATLMMGVGTGLSVALIAVGTVFARSWLEKRVVSASHNHTQNMRLLSPVLRLLGGGLLAVIGWSLFAATSSLTAGHPMF